MNRKITLLILFLTIIILIGMTEASADAFGQYLIAFKANYSSVVGTRIDQCLVCHTNHFGGARNPYGIDFEENGHNFARIESFDSDGDGFTNIDELYNRTFPGEAIDFPQVNDTETYGESTPQNGMLPISRIWILYVIAAAILVAAIYAVLMKS